MIALEGVEKRFGERRVLSALDLRVAEGETLVLLGPSGAGKSTLLRTIIGLEPFHAGRIRCFEHVLEPSTRSEQTLRAVRQSVGFCFQDFQLFAHRSALDNVAMPLALGRGMAWPHARDEARKVLSRMGALAFCERMPSSLSGGQKQRIALARALVLQPRAMLFDEPVSALDPERVVDVVEECRDLREKGVTVVVTTHHLAFARAVATRVAFMVDGAIVETGDAETLFTAPVNVRLRNYLEAVLG